MNEDDRISLSHLDILQVGAVGFDDKRSATSQGLMTAERLMSFSQVESKFLAVKYALR